MRTYRTAIIILAATLLAFSSGGQAQKEKERPTRDFMRLKLDYSRGILEGLTLEKFDLVITNATLLQNMNVTNAFLKLGNPDYRRRINAFQFSVDELRKAARKENLESATKAYARVTSNCVACHKQFRREQFLRSTD